MQKIALVWNAPPRLVDITIRYEPYVEALRQLGAEVITVCPAGSETGYPYPVRCFADEIEIREPEFWRGLDCEAAVIITWHRMTDIMKAMRAAGLKVLAIGESDGEISLRHHPWPTFRYVTYMQPTMRGKLGAAKHWLQRYLFCTAADDQAIVENVAAADLLALAGDGAVSEFRRLLERLGAGELAERIIWLPYPIAENFCTSPVTVDRANRVIAIGRWDSPQKNPGLLEATIRRLAAAGTGTEFYLVGNHSNERFARLARNHCCVRLFSVQPKDKIHELMASCRSILITSRWESGPIVASEMLALGGTVIGTPIINLGTITADGRFGRVSRAHSASSLAAAVVDEMAAWDRGERDPAAIADYWRRLVSPVGVGQRLLEMLEVPLGVMS